MPADNDRSLLDFNPETARGRDWWRSLDQEPTNAADSIMENAPNTAREVAHLVGLADPDAEDPRITAAWGLVQAWTDKSNRGPARTSREALALARCAAALRRVMDGDTPGGASSSGGLWTSHDHDYDIPGVTVAGPGRPPEPFSEDPLHLFRVSQRDAAQVTAGPAAGKQASAAEADYRVIDPDDPSLRERLHGVGDFATESANDLVVDVLAALREAGEPARRLEQTLGVLPDQTYRLHRYVYATEWTEGQR